MVYFYFYTKVVEVGGSSVPTVMVMGALLACEEHLHITVGFSLKIDSELGLLCRLEQPTMIEAITTGFKTKTGSEGPCRHRSLLVKKYKKMTAGLEPAIAALSLPILKPKPAEKGPVAILAF